jgi:hypothetical protein
MEAIRYWIEKGDASSAAAQLYSELAQTCSDYELAAARCLQARLNQGGMAGDRWACLAGMMMITTRGLNQDEVLEDVENQKAQWKLENGNRMPRNKPLPWYVFDTHTAVGKFAISVFAKHKMKEFTGLTKDRFDWIWFDLESAKVPKKLMKTMHLHSEAEPGLIDNMWWPCQVQMDLPFGPYDAKQVVQLWKKQMQPEIESIVNWCIKRRAEGK